MSLPPALRPVVLALTAVGSLVPGAGLEPSGPAPGSPVVSAAEAGRVSGPDPAEDALQTASLVSAATQAGLQRLDDLLVGDEPPAVVTALRERADTRVNSAWEVLGRPDAEYEPPSAMYRRKGWSYGVIRLSEDGAGPADAPAMAGAQQG